MVVNLGRMQTSEILMKATNLISMKVQTHPFMKTIGAPLNPAIKLKTLKYLVLSKNVS